MRKQRNRFAAEAKLTAMMARLTRGRIIKKNPELSQTRAEIKDYRQMVALARKNQGLMVRNIIRGVQLLKDPATAHGFLVELNRVMGF